MADFDSMVEDKATPAQTPAPTEGTGDFDSLVDDSEKYSTPGQMLKTAAEGAAEGVLGPIAPAAERAFGVKPEDMRGRKEENPILHGAAQAATLGGSMLIPGLGIAGVMGKAGEVAAHAIPALSEGMEGIKLAEMGVEAAKVAGKGVEEAKLALKAAEQATPLGFKVGSSAVQQAAEMAVLQSGDEASKMIMQDPNTSAESAMANIGMAAVFGGAAGAFITGTVSPLWGATVGPKVDAALGGLKNHLNGNTFMLPEELSLAQKTLGIDIPVELQAAISGNPTAIEHFNILKEGQHKGITDSLEKFHTDLSDSVSRSLGIAPEDVAVHSENGAGHQLLETFKKEYDQKYGPIAEAFEKRNAEAATINISDNARLDHYGKMLEEGMAKVGTDSPMYELYNSYGNRMLAKETIGGIDMLKTEIGGEIEKAIRAADMNRLGALRDIRTSLGDFQESQILKQASIVEKDGYQHAGALGRDMLKERTAANQMYKDFAKMSGELTDHLGTGRFTGAKGLTNKLSDKISAEQLMNKFSFKGNSDFIPFLQKNFPEVYAQVRENELKRFLKPAVLSAKGETPINIKKLSDLIDKGMAGQKEYIRSIMPDQAIDSVAAANQLTNAVPNVKSNGTAGWMTKMYKHMPSSAMAGVAMLSGHNPIMGAVLGHMAELLGRDAPDAIRLAHLKFLASDQPIKAEGFKAMVDFIHNSYKGETMLAKATTNMFKAGAQVMTSNMMPNEADRTKLDKAVSKLQDNPHDFLRMQNGQVGHYLPDHQQALTTASTRALMYLQQIKPKDHILGPLDKIVPPQPAEIARYNRALDIAQQPTVVLQHIKDGTILPSDIADLHNLYPSVYQNMVQKMSFEMSSRHADEEPIPYKTRLGISLFMGTPVDKTMEPMSIIAAQPLPKPPPEQMQAKGGGKSMKSLGKNISTYRTPGQAAENDRAKRD